jgi:two-component system, OmpR family, response regulator
MFTPTPPHVVVVEDEPDLRRDLVDFLALRSFTVTGCASAEEFETVTGIVDLVLLDLGLPRKDGLTLLKEIKANASKTRVIVLTAQGSDADHLRGLNAGADAYVVKNRSLPVIEATCRSVLQRRGDTVALLGWQLDAAAGTISTPSGLSIGISYQEVMFLQCVLGAAGQVVSRARILSELAKPDTLTNLRNLDTCVSRLRRKILQRAKVELPVRSAYGEGYLFHDGGPTPSVTEASAGTR